MSQERSPLLRPTVSAPAIDDDYGRKKEVLKYLCFLPVFTAPLAASTIVFYDVLFDVICKRLESPLDVCSKDPEATGAVADIFSAVFLLNGIVATVVMAALSALSDKIGRKFGVLWFMVLITLGTASYPLVAYAVPVNTTHWRMLVPYILIAASGTPTLLLNMSVLYITDYLPDPKVRTQFLSLLLGVAMLVQAVAPGVGGALLRGSGIHVSTYLSICAVLMALGATIFAVSVKEAPHKSQESAEGEGSEHLTVFQTVKRTFVNSFETISFSHCEDPVRRRHAWILLLNFFFSNEFAVGFIDLIMIYGKHKFGWVASTIGQNLFYIFSVRTAWALIGFPVLYGLLTKRWSAKPQDVDRADLTHMVLSSLLTLLGYLFMASARTSNQFTGGTIVLANDGISGPIWINALMKHVPENMRGEFMAALSIVNKPAGALVPALLMKVFQLTIDTQPSFVFYVVSVMALLLSLTLLMLRPMH